MAEKRISCADAAVNAAFARARLDYDMLSGTLRWKHWPHGNKAWNSLHAGKAVSATSTHGYLVTRLARHTHYVHRLIWLIVTGEWPEMKVDHINGISTDNRWANLRLADDAQSSANQKLRSDSASGHKGVSWNRRDQLWEAYISFRRVRHRLGRFIDIGDAIDARNAAAVRLHGAFARIL